MNLRGPELVREAKRHTPTLSALYRATLATQKTERGRLFVGLIVPASPWILWDTGEGKLECERCGGREDLPRPMGIGSAFLESLANRLTPWKEQHAKCGKPQEVTQ